MAEAENFDFGEVPEEGADVSDPVTDQDELTVEEQEAQTRAVAEEQRQEAIAEIEAEAPTADEVAAPDREVVFNPDKFTVGVDEDLGDEIRLSVAPFDEVVLPTDGSSVTVPADQAAALVVVPGVEVAD
jgi:hypothetical protein